MDTHDTHDTHAAGGGPRRTLAPHIEPWTEQEGDDMGQEQGRQDTRTRRRFLNGAAGVGAGITAVGFVDIFGGGAGGALAEAAGDPGAAAATIVNVVATAETLAVTFYYTVLTGATFRVDAPAVDDLRWTLEAEMRHLDGLRSLGGASLRQRFYLPDHLLTDAGVFVDTAVTLEATLAGAYLAATHQFAVLGQPLLAATAAQHAASEAQHLTLIGHLAGLPAHDLTLSTTAFHLMSDAVRALAPFLAGGTGFHGPLSVPSARQYQAARDASTAERRQPVTTP